MRTTLRAVFSNPADCVDDDDPAESMSRVLIKSIGVVTTAANDPDIPPASAEPIVDPSTPPK